MDGATRSLATYRPQRRPGMFLDMNSGKKVEFLCRLLGLQQAEGQADAFAKRARELLKALEVRHASVEAAEAAAAAAQQRLEAAGTVSAEDLRAAEEAVTKACELVVVREKVVQDTISEAANLKAQASLAVSLINERVDTEIRTLTEEIEVVQSQRADQVPQLVELWRAVTQANAAGAKASGDLGRAHVQRAVELGELDQQEATANMRAARLTDWKKAGREALAALKKLDAATCPTCAQGWAGPNADVERSRLTAALEQAKAGVADALAASSEAEQVRNTASQLPPIHDPRREFCDLESAALRAFEAAKGAWSLQNRGQVDSLKAERAAVEARRVSCEVPPAAAELEARVPTLRSAYNVARSAEGAARSELEGARRRAAVREALEAEAGRLSAAATAAKESYDAAAAEAALEADAGELVKRFLGAVVDEALTRIGDDASEILAHVKNTSHVSIGFTLQRETDSGTLIRRIEPEIRVRGRVVPFDSGISGGMQTPVELAVDLAFGRVAAERRGSYPGWLILDEALNGLGSVEKGSCLEMLGEFAGDRLVLVVDHDTSFQGLFSRTLHVEQSDGRARLL
jgi:hypothetical protein